MINAFGVEHTPVSKGLPSYLRALAVAPKAQAKASEAAKAAKTAKKSVGNKFPGPVKAAMAIDDSGMKHPEGAYMLSRMHANYAGKSAAKSLSRNPLSTQGRKMQYQGHLMRDVSRHWGRDPKSVVS
jgi:hypothetical protein